MLFDCCLTEQQTFEEREVARVGTVTKMLHEELLMSALQSFASKVSTIQNEQYHG